MQEGARMFRMDLGSGECGGHVVVALRGELDLLCAPAVATALEALAARQPRIIVDLAGLEFIDVSGIAALARGRTHARNAGGDLLPAAPRRPVRRVLTISGEADGFPIHASVAEAAASAGASRQVVAPRELARMRWQHIALASAGRSAVPATAAAEVAGNTEDADDDGGDQDESQNDHDVLPIESADRQPAGAQAPGLALSPPSQARPFPAGNSRSGNISSPWPITPHQTLPAAAAPDPDHGDQRERAAVGGVARKP
jgi:anti-sigma B factor antagonist